MAIPESTLSAETGERILEIMDFTNRPAVDTAGLRAVYQAWCYTVPFDNIRKLTALYSNESGELPGARVRDFFDHWLPFGTGGTCWATSNALWAFLRYCGFDARRIAASIHNTGQPNHGSVIVTVEGREWLLDSSMLTNEPLPLNPQQTVVSHGSLLRYEIEALEQSYIFWFEAIPRPNLVPCRMLFDPVNGEFYRHRYEITRAESPFNTILYARLNHPGEVRAIHGHTRYCKTAAGLDVRELDAEELQHCLMEDIGIAPEMVACWADSGALAESMKSHPPRELPEHGLQPPSSRPARNPA